MQVSTITLIGSSIRNGRIYFPMSDVKFFPTDSLSDREGDGHKGVPVVFSAGEFVFEGVIRVSSSTRLSPERSFAKFFKAVGAREGDALRVERVGDRQYTVRHIRMA